LKKINAGTIGIIAIIFVLIALIGLGVCAHFQTLTQIDKIESRVEQLEKNAAQAPSTEITEYTKTIDFLKEEQQTLIWMLGLILTGAIGVLAFLGVKTRKDVENIVRERYEVEFNNRLAGNIEKEKFAKQKPILFIYQKEDNKLLSTINFYRTNGYSVKAIPTDDLPKDKVLIKNKLGVAKIVVYQAKEDNDKECISISAVCEDTKMDCIHFCADISAPPEIRKDFGEHSTTVNYPSKLRESLFSLLYFAP